MIDWVGLIVVGLHHLRLTPDQFWALTPAELAVMVSGVALPDAGMSRARLNDLIAEFPDV